jgi:hypothetical protein
MRSFFSITADILVEHSEAGVHGAAARASMGTAPFVLGSDADNDMYARLVGALARVPIAVQSLVGRTSGNVAGIPIAVQRLVGRITGGDLGELTAAQVMTLLQAMPAGAYELTDDATIAIDWDNGATQYVVLGATGRTVTFANPVSGQVYRFIIIQDATGSRTITTWPSVKWAWGSSPTLTTTGDKIDIVTLLYAGTTYYGDFVNNF